MTEECKPARIKREEETAVHFLEIPEGVFQGQGEPVQGLTSELGESLGSSEDISTARLEGGEEGRQEIGLKKWAAADHTESRERT